MGPFAGRIVAAAVVVSIWSAAAAEECAIQTFVIDRGERAPFVLCAPGLDESYRLAGLEGTDITVAYEQYLKRCDVTVADAGLHLVLEAGRDARSATLRAANESSGACHEFRFEVPKRHLLPPATLEPTSGKGRGVYRLTVEADRSVAFPTDCAKAILFPPSRGPGLALRDGSRVECAARRLSVEVEARGERRQPAKIVTPIVHRDGAAGEAVAHVELPPPDWAGSMNEEDAEYVEVGGIRTRYYVKGSGPALVLVHGGQPSSPDASAWTWTTNFDALAKRFRVYALDRLGQGYTDNPRSGEDYDRYYERVVEHVLGFMDAVGIGRAALVGHSQGGWPVTRIALDHPERVSCLVNVDTSSVAPAASQETTVQFYMYHSVFLHPSGGHTRESIRRANALFSVTGNNLTDEDAERSYGLSQTAKFKAAAREFTSRRLSPAHPSYRALKDAALEDMRAGKLRVPTLIVWGHDDPEGSYEVGVALFKLVSATNPNSALHVFGRSGHAPFVEYPERFNALVTGFCGSHI